MDRNDTSCTDVQAALPLFVGYDLEAPEMEKVAGHLDTCPTCHALAGRAQSAREVLWTLRDDASGGARPAPALSAGGPDLWPGVRAELVREGLLEARPMLSSGPRRVWFGGIAAAAAAVLLVTLAQVFDPVPNTPVQPVASSSPGSGQALAGVTTVSAPAGGWIQRGQPVHPLALSRASRNPAGSAGVVTVSDSSRSRGGVPQVFPVAGHDHARLAQAWNRVPGKAGSPRSGDGRLAPAGPDSEHLIDSALPFGAEFLLPRPALDAGDASSLVGGRRRLH